MVKPVKLLLSLLSLFLLSSLSIKAQDQDFSASVLLKTDTNRISIGDQFQLHIKAQLPQNSDFQWPVFKEQLSDKIEIIAQSPLDSLTKNGIQYISQILTLTCFDSGEWVIPVVKISLTQNGDSSVLQLASDSINIQVTQPSIDSDLAIKDIKNIESAPISWAEIWPWILWLSSGAILLIVLIFVIRKIKKKEPIIEFNKKPKTPPYQWAIEEMDKLRKAKLWQADKHKAYYSQLTDILRKYIQLTQGIPAMEMTTEELALALKKLQTDSGLHKHIKATLQLADLVKFAKLTPLPDENSTAFNHILAFIEAYKPAEEEENKNKDALPEKQN